MVQIKSKKRRESNKSCSERPMRGRQWVRRRTEVAAPARSRGRTQRCPGSRPDRQRRHIKERAGASGGKASRPKRLIRERAALKQPATHNRKAAPEVTPTRPGRSGGGSLLTHIN